MEEAVPAGEGAMAAVLGMEAAKIEEILSGISGATLPITTARVRLSSPDMRRQCRGFGKVKRSRRKAVLPLNVSGPFHSPMMEAASQG